MVKAKTAGTIVICFSLLVAFISFFYGYHRERVNSMNRLKDNAVLSLEKSSFEGNWFFALAGQTSSSKSPKTKVIYKATINVDDSIGFSGQSSTLDDKAIGDIIGSGKNGNVFMRWTEGSSSNNINFSGIMPKEFCVSGKYFYDDGRFGKFVGLKFDGNLEAAKIEESIQQICGLPN